MCLWLPENTSVCVCVWLGELLYLRLSMFSYFKDHLSLQHASFSVFNLDLHSIYFNFLNTDFLWIRAGPIIFFLNPHTCYSEVLYWCRWRRTMSQFMAVLGIFHTCSLNMYLLATCCVKQMASSWVSPRSRLINTCNSSRTPNHWLPKAQQCFHVWQRAYRGFSPTTAGHVWDMLWP